MLDLPARFFLVLIEGVRRAPDWLLLLAVAITTVVLAYDTPQWPPPMWLFAGIPLFLILGSVEPALVVLVSADVGLLWAGSTMAAFAAGIVIATAVVYVRLQQHRGRSPTIPAYIGAVALLTSIAVSPFIREYHELFLPGIAAVILATFGMDILLPKNVHIKPRLPYFFGGFWVFFFMAILQITLLVVCRLILRFPMPALRRLGGRGMRALFRWFPYGRFDREGIRPISEPCVLVSNHQSSVDIPIILSLPGDIRLTLSERVWRQPWLGIAARKLGHIVADEHVLDRCRKVFDEGASVHFFPEGTRSKDGFPARFHRGAFELAVQLQRPVVPVLLCDSATCVPRDAYWVERFHMSIRMLDPVEPGNDSRALQKKVQLMMRRAHAEELKRINTKENLRRKVLRRYRYMGWRAYVGVRNELLEPEKQTEHCGWGARVHWQSEKEPGEKFSGKDPDPDKIGIAEASARGKPRVTFETT